MNFKEYQEKAIGFAVYPEEYRVFYPLLGLTGEVGEVAEKIKKWLRDNNRPTDEQLISELGDVLWYLANTAKDLNLSLQFIAEYNIEKLQSRKDRNKIKGSGDDR